MHTTIEANRKLICARSVREILADDYSGRDFAKYRTPRTVIAKAAPPLVERITTARTSSSIAVELSSYIETNRLSGESVSAAWARMSIDPKASALYAAYRDTLTAEARKGVAMNPSDSRQAAIERDAVEKEITAAARDLMARDINLSLAAATAKVLDMNPSLYSRFLSAKQRQTSG
ncbi:MAG: hypothetical protein HY059_11690 [Proteobacteria bacterium]|nr:hypothetical protein [Pseudomonadota bacterium]